MSTNFEAGQRGASSPSPRPSLSWRRGVSASRSTTRQGRFSSALGLGLALLAAVQPWSVMACAACYGASDSPMAKGMNAGIFSLLGVVVVVLGSVAGFFIYLAKKSASAAQPVIPTTETTL